MKTIKALFVFVWFCSFHAFSHADGLKPLPDVLQIFLQTKDLSQASYLSNRCAALNTAIAGLMASSDKAISMKFADAAREHMKMAIQFAAVHQKEQRDPLIKRSEEQLVEQAGQAVNSIFDLYVETMNSNYARTGSSIGEDNELRQETYICAYLIQPLNAAD